MNHQEKLFQLKDDISELLIRYQFEFNIEKTRLQICGDLKYLFLSKFDDYWQKLTGILPSELKFVDLTTQQNANNYSYQIGVSVNGQSPVQLLEFLSMIELSSVREYKLNQVLNLSI